MLKEKNDDGVIYTDGFGLNDDDIIKLINFEECVANFWINGSNKGSTDEIRAACEEVLEQIEQIRAGKLDIQIRAEILMRVSPATACANKTIRNENKDTSTRISTVKYSNSRAYYFLTFRECLALAKITGSNVTDPMINCAKLLYENDEPWRSEAKYVEEAKIYGQNYWLGWDYIQFENPYQVDKTVVTETAKLKNADGTVTVLSGPTETKITEDTTFTRPTNNYTYTGLEFDGGTKSQVTSQVVKADNGAHTIVYWYEVEKKTTITINYKDEKTGENICPSEMVEPGTHSKKDFDGYEYTGLEIVKPTPESKDPNKTSVTITDDKEAHEVTFWYKPEEITIVKVTHKSKGGQILQVTQSHTIKENDSPKLFSQIGVAGGWKYIGVDVTCDGNTLKSQATDTSVTVSYNGSVTYEITFWYAMQTQVKIIGRCEGKTDDIYSVILNKENIPLNKTYEESEHEGKDYNASYYTYLKEYEVKLGTHAYLGEKGETLDGNSVQVTVNEATNAPQKILIVFYYESNFKAEVQHIYVSPITKQNETKETDTYSITPDEMQKIPSMQMTNENGDKCLNVWYEGEDIVASGFVEYGTKSYELTLTPKEKSYIIKLYYTSQTITVKHQKTDGTDLIDLVNKILSPQEEEKTLPEYPFKNWKLNETETGTETPKKVSIKEGTLSQELIFYYQEPNLIFGPDDPNDYQEYPDGKTYKDMVNACQTGIIPSDLNNQKIGQKDNEYYWVLNENGGITVRFATTHLEEGSGSCSFVAKVKIPFDVYVNSALKSANTQFTITCSYKKTDNGYDIYEGTLKNIYVPIWVTEGDYTITANVTQTYTANDSTPKTTSSDASATVKVVGAVYDFTITNLDGSDTTGDAMWKKALFGTAKEYKATETAVGQGTQQAKNYNYGIKRGTRFYFSLNTLGQKSQKIKIVPTFYYINNKGVIERVYMGVDANSKLKLEDKRTISLTDDNRTTDEFKKERAEKKKDTNATAFEIGDYTQITLDQNVNTPYLDIANDKDYKLLVNENKGKTLSDYANHWYGDYTIPNNAKFYLDEKKTNLVSDETGVVVVYFEIKTICKDDKGKDEEYLAYNGHSPFVQTDEISEWDYERKSSGTSMILPKTTGQTSPTTSSDSWKQLKSTATIIYSLKSNVTTKQNVTSIGTH